MYGLGSIDYLSLKKRVRAADYLVVAQLFLQSNFLLKTPLTSDDIKPRLLGHWGTCHGIDVVYSSLRQAIKKFEFVLGPGHGFPALQANLFIDGDLEKIDPELSRNSQGIAKLCREFSWPGGFPSHASPYTPGVICEGGELGYALGAAYGSALGHPEKTVAVLIGDGEFETATALASMNLSKIMSSDKHGLVIPILHLNGYKISGPTISGRKSDRELSEQIRGFGYRPILADENNLADKLITFPRGDFIIFRSEKGEGGPSFVKGQKIAGNYLSHQIPLKNPKTDPLELSILETWLKSYNFSELFDETKGFTL